MWQFFFQNYNPFKAHNVPFKITKYLIFIENKSPHFPLKYSLSNQSMSLPKLKKSWRLYLINHLHFLAWMLIIIYCIFVLINLYMEKKLVFFFGCFYQQHIPYVHARSLQQEQLKKDESCSLLIRYSFDSFFSQSIPHRFTSFFPVKVINTRKKG